MRVQPERNWLKSWHVQCNAGSQRTRIQAFRQHMDRWKSTAPLPSPTSVPFTHLIRNLFHVHVHVHEPHKLEVNAATSNKLIN